MTKSKAEINGKYQAFADCQAQGLTKREYFAGQALAGICANPAFVENFNDTAKVCSDQALLMADSMLKRLAGE